MKRKIVFWILCICLCTTCFSACAAERYDPLYVVDQDEFTFTLRGTTGKQAKQLVIKKDDEILLAEKLKTSKSVGTQGGTYGMQVLDLNFDGHMDVMVATDLEKECIFYQCWLWNPSTETFERSEALSGLANIKTDANTHSVFAYATKTTSTPAPSSEHADLTVVRDTTTKYIWENGILHPSVAVSMTYYSETDRYEYAVYYYNAETGQMEEDQNKWMTPQEYREADLAFIYYFR